MELRHYASIFWRWLWLIALGTVLAAGTSYLVSKSMPRVYASTATLLVNQAQTPGTMAYNDVLTSQQLTKTYSQLIIQTPVLQSAIDSLHLAITPEQLSKQLSVQVVLDTMLLKLTAQSTDPKQAADIATAVSKAFIDENRRLQLGQASTSRDSLEKQLQSLNSDIQAIPGQIDQLRSNPGNRTPEAAQAEIARLQNTLSQDQLNYSQLLKADQDMQLAEAKAYSSVSIAGPAVVPVGPVSPKTAQNVVLAALVGLMLAVGVVLLIEYLDDTVKSDEMVAGALGVPVLGYIRRLKGRDRDGGGVISAAAANPRLQVAEAFRALRTNLQFSLLDRPGKLILVSSAGAGEGKTTTVFNLGLVMAQAGKRVILVDTDLRRPSLHKQFNLRNDQGVTTALLDPAGLGPEVLRPTGVPDLAVLTSGPLPPNPSELLGSARMVRLVEKLREHADVVLFDSPPILAVTDPVVMSSLMDGVLLVVDSGRTRAPALVRAREAVELAAGPNKILGAVLNKLTARAGQDTYYHYYQHYSSEPRDARNGNGHVRADELVKK